MNPRSHAIRVGLARGWTEFVLSMRSRQDLGFYVVTAAVLLWILLASDGTVEGTELSTRAFALPSLLGGLVIFGSLMGPASALVLERQDGTLLRSRLAPHGLAGYTAGQIVLHTLSTAPLLLVAIVPSMVLFDGLMTRGALGWAIVVVAALLGLASTLPFGLLVGAVIPGGPQKLGLYVFLPFGALVAVSGIFVPLSTLWGWVQVVGQILPMYWLGHLMRFAFLPADAALLEPMGSFQPWLAVGVLVVWGIVGALAMPPVLRRMSRRQSGSAVAEARETAAQFVR